MIPRLWKDMPADKPGRWVAVVIRQTCFRSREVWEREVTGLRRAYLWARWMALVEDLRTPYCSGEIGIDWAVREVKQ